MKTIINYRKRIRLHLISMMILTLFIQLTTQAQISKVIKGDRVRVHAPGVHAKSIVGTVYDVSPATIFVISKDSTLTIPFSSVKRLDISRGQKRHAGKGALIGAVAGGLALGLILKSGNDSGDECENSTGYVCISLTQFEDGLAFWGGTLIGALGGGIIGGTAGMLIKSDRWDRIPLKFSAVVAPNPDQAFSLNPTISVRLSIKRKP